MVIGVVGEKGAGKGTFVKFFKELCQGKKIEDFRFSDILKETLDLWNIPSTRVNLQKIAVVMRDNFAKDALTSATHKRVENLTADLILIEGLRWKTDEEMVRSFPENKLVYISADPKIRYERLKKRNEKVGEDTTTLTQFLEEEKAVNETLIPEIGQKADFKVDNNGSFEELKRQIEQFCKNL